MNSRPELFGFFGFTHGWGKLLTVMSPQGARATVAAIEAGDGVVLQTADGKLPQYHEKREGALDRLVEKHNIVILGKSEWDEKKAVLGDNILK